MLLYSIFRRTATIVPCISSAVHFTAPVSYTHLYIPADELENFRAQIERRKELEQELKALKKQLPKAKPANLSAFTTNVRTGGALRSFAASVRGYRRRACFRQLRCV